MSNSKNFKFIASLILLFLGLLITFSTGASTVQANSVYLSTNASCFPPKFKIDLTALKNGTPESNLPVTLKIKINGASYDRSGTTNSQGKWSYTWDITDPGTASISYSVSSSAPGVSGSTNISMTCSGPVVQPTATPAPTEPASPTSTPTETPAITPTPTELPSVTATATASPTVSPTPTTAPPSCNGYRITGVANDPDRPGASVVVSILITDIFSRQYSYTVASSAGNFLFNIPDEFKDGYLHSVSVSASNPYTSQVWVSTGVDADGNATGYWRTVNNPSYAYADNSAFECEPPSTDLTSTGEAWAKKPGRTGSYSNGDLATEVVWLEDSAQFEVIVENLDPVLPALNAEFVINLPDNPSGPGYPNGFLDWEIVTDPNWNCSTSNTQIKCQINRFESFHTKTKYMTGETKYTLIEAESLVPGYFIPEMLEWNGTIDSETIDRALANNDTFFDLKVIKTWQQAVSHTELLSQFNQAIYHEAITDQLTTEAPERSFDSDELISSLYQVPIYSVPAITVSSYPTLTVKFCMEYDEPNCSNESAIIEGAVRLNGYELNSTQKQLQGGTGLIDDPSVPDLQTGPINLSYGLTGGGRFVDEDQANCQIWQDRMSLVGESSECAGKYELYSTFSGTDQARYAWADSEMMGLLLYSSGGRQILCDKTDGECIISNAGKPGIYKTNGTIDYEVIFFDNEFERIGADPLYYPYVIDFQIFIQQVTKFQEMER